MSTPCADITDPLSSPAMTDPRSAPQAPETPQDQPLTADGRRVRVIRHHGYEAGPWVGRLMAEGRDAVRGRWVRLEIDGQPVEISERVPLPITIEPVKEQTGFLGMEP